MLDTIRRQLDEHQDVVTRIKDELSPAVADMATRLITCFQAGGKLLVMGNGGSAADAQHFAGEIVSRFRRERPGLPAIALSTDTSVLTAIGNDYGYDAVFRRQVEALAAPGDVVVGISTSGNSPNVQCAMTLAREKGCTTIGLLGRDGGSIHDLCDLALVVPSSDTPRIQEGHITIIHIVCDLVEEQVFAG